MPISESMCVLVVPVSEEVDLFFAGSYGVCGVKFYSVVSGMIIERMITGLNINTFIDKRKRSNV